MFLKDLAFDEWWDFLTGQCLDTHTGRVVYLCIKISNTSVLLVGSENTLGCKQVTKKVTLVYVGLRYWQS